MSPLSTVPRARNANPRVLAAARMLVASHEGARHLEDVLTRRTRISAK